MTNGDKVREAMSKLSDRQLAQFEYCNVFQECDECPLNGLEHCSRWSANDLQVWMSKEVKDDKR